MPVRIFASELSNCRAKKLLYGVVISVCLFVIFIVFPIMWIFKAPIKKTTRDFVYEYIANRENYTYQDVDKAFHGQYQYMYPMYDNLNSALINYIKSQQMYQGFHIDSITFLPKTNEWIVSGMLFRCMLDNLTSQYTCSSKEKRFRVKEINGKFVVENSRNG